MIKIDFTADAAYVYLPGVSDLAHPKRTRVLTDAILIDVDNHERPIGVEILGLKTEIPIGALVRLDIPDETIRELLTLANASISAPEETWQ